MEYAFSTAALRMPDRLVAPRLLSGRVLVRLIEFSFATTEGTGYSFFDTFRDFAEACFTLSLEDEGVLSRWPALEEQAVDTLAQVFDEAVASGRLAPSPSTTRLTAVMVLTSLAAFQQEVIEGRLGSSEAADLLAEIVFDGLQAAPSQIVQPAS